MAFGVRSGLRVVLAVVVVALGGCGYRVAGYGADADQAPGVCVSTFENDSRYVGVELLVSEALRKEFLRRGGGRLESDCERAELVISGRVRPVMRRSQSFSSTAYAVEYTLTIELDTKLQYHDGGEFRFAPGALRYSEIYLASADVEVERKNRQEAMRRIAQVLAARVHDAIDVDRVAREKARR
jgi:hypothetical protein